MAHHMLKPRSLLFYLLSLIFSFFVGLIIAGILEAGKGQMLAGGAIVLGYGVVAAIIGLIFAFFITGRASRKFVVTGNIVLVISIIAIWGYFYIRHQNKQNAKEKENIEQPKKQTSPGINTLQSSKAIAMLAEDHLNPQANKAMGLGMFSPNLFEMQVLYFYGNLNLEKSVLEHWPTDSITFKQSQYGGFDIVTAPPYLLPDHLKMDYDMLYFRVVSVTEDFIEVIVNTTTEQTAFVDRRFGTLYYWPEFLLRVNSVEFIYDDGQEVLVKPLDHAGTVQAAYSFMRPVRIKQDWIFVHLLNQDFKKVGKGWIKWYSDEKLLIKYSLLS